MFVYPLLIGEPFDRGELKRRLIETSAEHTDLTPVLPEPKADQRRGFKRAHIVHPYLGFVGNPELLPGLSSFGLFADPHELIETDDFVVLITGGSVANAVFHDASRNIESELNRLPRLANRKVRIVSSAFPGYKQPQQLISFAWFLSIGARIDVVINVDGYNEINLPMAEAIPNRVYPFFPRSWDIYSEELIDQAPILDVAHVMRLRSIEEKLNHFFGSKPVVFSNLMLAIWDQSSRVLGGMKLATRKRILDHYQALESNRRASGPTYPETDVDRVLADLVSVWLRSSLQMSYLSRANGIEYFHFLQPNQYIEGSKRLTQAERARAYRMTPVNRLLQPAYKRMIKIAAGHPVLGREFVDLSMMFVDDSRDLYIDVCCHLNSAGNGEIGARIATVVKRRLVEGSARQR